MQKQRRGHEWTTCQEIHIGWVAELSVFRHGVIKHPEEAAALMDSTVMFGRVPCHVNMLL